jgi:hypothetical protein
MQTGELLKRVRPLLRQRLPAELSDFRWEASFLAKVWYGNHALHYEITPRPRLRTIEIGLHFEADPLTNARLLAAFRANAKAVRSALADARLEEWDRGWCRVWESLPWRPPDTELARELADRVAAYVVALEPILRRELPRDVAWAEPERPPARVKAAAPSRGSRATR